ncbi:MAG: LytR/AlgR family response regulator transcription factor [Gemmatimonadaceae bacterium]
MPKVANAMRLSAVIADDEPLARQALRRFLSADDDVAVVAEAEDLPQLRAVLARVTPDVVFLDIMMPGGIGLDVLPAIPSTTAIVFATAHADFAASAFDVDAVDYLVKPFGAGRVRDALARVRRWRLTWSASQAGSARASAAVILVRVGSRLVPVDAATIWRVEGADDNVRLICEGREWLHSATMQTMEAQLDASVFVRIHRSHLVNLTRVKSVVSLGDRRLAVVFPDGSQVVCSRAGAAELRRRR